MLESYFPNALRRELFEPAEEYKDGFIPDFLMKFDPKEDKHFQALQSYSLGVLIESVVLYDRVYLDVMDFPFIVSALYRQEPDVTIQLIKNGAISVFQSPMWNIFPKRINGDDHYSWGLIGRPEFVEHDLAEQLSSSFQTFLNKKLSQSDVSDCISAVEKTARRIDCDDYQRFGTELCEKVDKEIKSGCYKSLGIATYGEYFITENNANAFYHMGNVICNNRIASEAGIENIIYTDYEEFFAKERYRRYNALPSNFEELLKLNKIPNFRQAYWEGNLQLADALSIKENKAYPAFIRWLRENTENDNNILQEFVEALKTPLSDTTKWKTIRYIPQAVLGLLSLAGGFLGLASTGLGLAATTIDAFLAGDIVDQRSPTALVDTIKQRVANVSSNTKEKELTAISYDSGFVLDNEEEIKYNSRLQYQRLDSIAEGMKNNANDEEKCYSLYREGLILVKDCLYPNCVVKYLYINHLLERISPNHFKEALIRLDAFLYNLPIDEPLDNQDVVAKYYFGTVNNAVITKGNDWYDSIELKCVYISHDNHEIKPKTQRMNELFQRFLSNDS